MGSHQISSNPGRNFVTPFLAVRGNRVGKKFAHPIDAFTIEIGIISIVDTAEEEQHRFPNVPLSYFKVDSVQGNPIIAFAFPPIGYIECALA